MLSHRQRAGRRVAGWTSPSLGNLAPGVEEPLPGSTALIRASELGPAAAGSVSDRLLRDRPNACPQD